MQRGVELSVALVLSVAAQAAEPPVRATTPRAMPATAPRAAAPKPLDLRIGDIRKYMMPNDFHAALTAPDQDKSTILVEGTRDLPPLKSQQPIPGGIVAPFWAIAHPLQAWKIFAPDVNAPAAGPSHDKVPPPNFRP